MQRFPELIKGQTRLKRCSFLYCVIISHPSISAVLLREKSALHLKLKCLSLTSKHPNKLSAVAGIKVQLWLNGGMKTCNDKPINWSAVEKWISEYFDKGTERKFSSFLIKNLLFSAFLGFTLVDVNIWSITKEMGVNIYKALFNIL